MFLWEYISTRRKSKGDGEIMLCTCYGHFLWCLNQRILYCKLCFCFSCLIFTISYTKISPSIILSDITDLQTTPCQKCQYFRVLCVECLLIFHPSTAWSGKSQRSTWQHCTLTNDSKQESCFKNTKFDVISRSGRIFNSASSLYFGGPPLSTMQW